QASFAADKHTTAKPVAVVDWAEFGITINEIYVLYVQS
ncbi:unnamed protein product, partial [marine sediment metagenome]